MGTTVLVASILEDGHVFQENRTPTKGLKQSSASEDGFE
jgi:hypothetical protein